MNFDALFQPAAIGTMQLKNRIIFNPCESLFASLEGEVTQKLIDYYVRRAEGGASLLVVHSAQACPKIDPNDPFAGSVRIDDNAYIPMLGELTEAVHRAGAKIAILVSAGGGACCLGFPYDRGLEGFKEIHNVGVTEKQSLVAQRQVRMLSIDEIKRIIEMYGMAARRVMTAGFDAMYIHALNYLIGQFISPLYNDRDDEYGGDFDRRMRFLLEIVEACRRNVGPAYPLVVRMAIDECFPGARGVEESLEVARRLEAAGVSAIDASAGIYESMHMIIPPMYLPKGILTDYAAAVKKAVNIPVITQGRLYDPELNNRVITEGKADFIGMARGLLADPHWSKKLEQDRLDDIRRCITCNQCIDRVVKGLTIRCAINPTVGREGEFKEVPAPAQRVKKVVVVGAGPGGMEAARTAALRGHSVRIIEKSKELGGGQLRLAAGAPHKEEFLNMVRFYQAQFDKMENIEVILNKEASVPDLEAASPDAVVLATGATALVPALEGIDRPNVFTNHDLPTWSGRVKGKIVIIGGGCAGAGTADKLSEEGHDVTIVEMLQECALDEELITRLTLLHRFEEKKVRILANYVVKRIVDEGVVAFDESNQEVTIPADFVIVAFGAVSHNPLEREVKQKFSEYYVIGDAIRPRKIKEAVAEGFFAGSRI